MQSLISSAFNMGLILVFPKKEEAATENLVFVSFSLFLFWCTLVPMETTLGWLESDIYKCRVRSFLSTALKFKPWFEIYSEPSLTYSEGLWKDNILNAEIRHVTALCSFQKVQHCFVYRKTERASFPQFAFRNPGNAAGLLNMEGREPPPFCFLPYCW